MRRIRTTAALRATENRPLRGLGLRTGGRLLRPWVAGRMFDWTRKTTTPAIAFAAGGAALAFTLVVLPPAPRSRDGGIFLAACVIVWLTLVALTLSRFACHRTTTEPSSPPRTPGSSAEVSQTWVDGAITSKEEDAFERSGYSSAAAHLIIRTHSWKDSIVFGLTGPWGSGKSSMLKMITDELLETNPEWHIARFTPWATSDVSGLLGDFYASLGAALPHDLSQQVRKAFGTLAKVAAPVASAIPVAGSAASASLELTSDGLLKQTPWDTAFRDAAEALKNIHRPVLVVADDIDRLHTDELLALLKVVRLLGRFPGVQYLLAYDEATLNQTLSETALVNDVAGAGRFMEKIVQYPLVVPPLLRTQLLKRINEGLVAALTDTGRSTQTDPRLGSILDVYLTLLSTPRAIDRYIAQLRYHLPLLAPSEINDTDVIVLTLLRTTFPTLYNQLPRWRDELTSGRTTELSDTASTTQNQDVFKMFDPDKDLLKAVSPESKAAARTLLLALFPKLDTTGLTFSGSDRCRIHDPNYFDRYFAMGVPAHDIADFEVALAVKEASVGRDAALRALLTAPDAERATLAIGKAAPVARAINHDGERLALARSVISQLDRISALRSFLVSPVMLAAALVGDLLTDLTENTSSRDILDVLHTAPTTALRLEVIRLTGRTRHPPACWNDVIDTLVGEVTNELVANLTARDAAPEAIGPGAMIHFLATNNQIDPLQTAIARGLDAGNFTLADVAARCITLHTANDSTVTLGEFNQEIFANLVPTDPDPWYDLPPLSQISETDLSWSNRKAYVTGIARQPTTPLPES